MGWDSCYDVLDVPADAAPEEIRAAFRRLSKQVHPDRGGSTALFRRVQDAYDTLSDPRRHAQYDRALSSDPSGGFAARRGAHHDPSHAEDVDLWRRGRPAHHAHVALLGGGALLAVVGVAVGGLPGAALVALGLWGMGTGALVATGRRVAAWRDGDVPVGTPVRAMAPAHLLAALEGLFAEMGYQVTPATAWDEFGTDLVLDGAGSRVVVLVDGWWTHDAVADPPGSGEGVVEAAPRAAAHHGATQAIVVLRSPLERTRAPSSARAVVVWDPAALAYQLGRSQLSVWLGAGAAVCLSRSWRAFTSVAGDTDEGSTSRRPRW